MNPGPCPSCGHDAEDGITITAQDEDVKFAFMKDGRLQESSTKITFPLCTCNKCKFQWSDHYTEVLRTEAVDRARAQEEKLLKDCPCCGMKQSEAAMDLIDSLHPTGAYWTEMYEQGEYLGRSYWTPHFLGKAQDDPTLPKIDGSVWKYTCRESVGGCGLNISGHSREEVIQKWNTRKG